MLSLRQGAQFMKERYGLKESVDQIIAEVNEGIYHEYANVIQPKPGVVAFLHALHDQGVPLAIASVTAVHLLRAALERTELLDLFKTVVSVDDCAHSKDQPDVYHKACQALQTTPATTWVFEDAHHAMKTAVAAGYPVVAVQDSSAVGSLSEALPMVHLATPTLGVHMIKPLLNHPGASSPPGCTITPVVLE